MHVLSIFSSFRLCFKNTLNSWSCMIFSFTWSELRKTHYFFYICHIILQILFFIFKFIVLFQFYLLLFIQLFFQLFWAFFSLCLLIFFLWSTSLSLCRFCCLLYFLFLFRNVITHIKLINAFIIWRTILIKHLRVCNFI